MNQQKNKPSTKGSTSRKATSTSPVFPVNSPPFNLFPDSSSLCNSDSNSDHNEKKFEQGLESIAEILKHRKNVVVLAGAGISVSCGIPDFRSKGTGIYHNMDANELGLSTPEELFHLECFQDDPRPFYKFASTMLYPVKEIEPSPSHQFLSLLEQKKMLLRVYTQNIDGLEEKAGVSSKKIVYAHGSLNTSTCLNCGQKASADELRHEIIKGNVPYCKRVLNNNRKRKRKRKEQDEPSATEDDNNKCLEVPKSLLIEPRKKRSTSNYSTGSQTFDFNEEGDVVRTCDGIMKPNITFFGEQLVDRVRKCLEADRKKADAVIVIGTSLSVAPMSKIIEYLSPAIPRILINRMIVVPKHGSYCEGVMKGVGKDNKSSCDDGDNDDNDDDVHTNCTDHRDNFVFDACLLGNCDEVTKSLIELIDKKKTKEDIYLRNRIETSKSAQQNDFSVLSNLDEYKEELNMESLFRHPHDRIFIYPGACLARKDANADDSDVSKEIVLDEVVHCDGCSEVVKNTIMKCADCFDYDLCKDCYPTFSKSHFQGNHKFVTECRS